MTSYMLKLIQTQLYLQIPALEAQLLQSLVPRDEADQRDVVLEVRSLILCLPVVNGDTDTCSACVSRLLPMLMCLSQCDRFETQAYIAVLQLACAMQR